MVISSRTILNNFFRVNFSHFYHTRRNQTAATRNNNLSRWFSQKVKTIFFSGGNLQTCLLTLMIVNKLIFHRRKCVARVRNGSAGRRRWTENYLCEKRLKDLYANQFSLLFYGLIRFGNYATCSYVQSVRAALECNGIFTAQQSQYCASRLQGRNTETESLSRCNWPSNGFTSIFSSAISSDLNWIMKTMSLVTQFLRIIAQIHHFSPTLTYINFAHYMSVSRQQSDTVQRYEAATCNLWCTENRETISQRRSES